jgi:arabinosyltransferase A/arabinosyltransferase B/arabinosyltransferase C
VRLAVDAPADTRPSAVASMPRAPRLTPMTQLLPPGTNAVLDWPVAFLFPCLTPEPLPPGTAGLAAWRVAPPAEETGEFFTYAPDYGGPFAAPRLLITEQRMPTYLAGDPLRDAAEVYRWEPLGPFARPEPLVTERTVTGWHRTGHARVPEVDPVG